MYQPRRGLPRYPRINRGSGGPPDYDHPDRVNYPFIISLDTNDDDFPPDQSPQGRQSGPQRPSRQGVQPLMAHPLFPQSRAGGSIGSQARLTAASILGPPPRQLSPGQPLLRTPGLLASGRFGLVPVVTPLVIPGKVIRTSGVQTPPQASRASPGAVGDSGKSNSVQPGKAADAQRVSDQHVSTSTVNKGSSSIVPPGGPGVPCSAALALNGREGGSQEVDESPPEGSEGGVAQSGGSGITDLPSEIAQGEAAGGEGAADLSLQAQCSSFLRSLSGRPGSQAMPVGGATASFAVIPSGRDQVVVDEGEGVSVGVAVKQEVDGTSYDSGTSTGIRAARQQARALAAASATEDAAYDDAATTPPATALSSNPSPPHAAAPVSPYATRSATRSAAKGPVISAGGPTASSAKKTVAGRGTAASKSMTAVGGKKQPAARATTSPATVSIESSDDVSAASESQVSALSDAETSGAPAVSGVTSTAGSAPGCVVGDAGVMVDGNTASAMATAGIAAPVYAAAQIALSSTQPAPVSENLSCLVRNSAAEEQIAAVTKASDEDIRPAAVAATTAAAPASKPGSSPASKPESSPASKPDGSPATQSKPDAAPAVTKGIPAQGGTRVSAAGQAPAASKIVSTTMPTSTVGRGVCPVRARPAVGGGRGRVWEIEVFVVKREVVDGSYDKALSTGANAASAGAKAGSAGTQVSSAGAKPGSAGVLAGSAGAHASSTGAQAISAGVKAVNAEAKASLSAGAQAVSLGAQTGGVGAQAGSAGAPASGSAGAPAPAPGITQFRAAMPQVSAAGRPVLALAAGSVPGPRPAGSTPGPRPAGLGHGPRPAGLGPGPRPAGSVTPSVQAVVCAVASMGSSLPSLRSGAPVGSTPLRPPPTGPVMRQGVPNRPPGPPPGPPPSRFPLLAATRLPFGVVSPTSQQQMQQQPQQRMQQQHARPLNVLDTASNRQQFLSASIPAKNTPPSTNLSAANIPASSTAPVTLLPVGGSAVSSAQTAEVGDREAPTDPSLVEADSTQAEGQTEGGIREQGVGHIEGKRVEPTEGREVGPAEGKKVESTTSDGAVSVTTARQLDTLTDSVEDRNAASDEEMMEQGVRRASMEAMEGEVRSVGVGGTAQQQTQQQMQQQQAVDSRQWMETPAQSMSTLVGFRPTIRVRGRAGLVVSGGPSRHPGPTIVRPISPASCRELIGRQPDVGVACVQAVGQKDQSGMSDKSSAGNVGEGVGLSGLGEKLLEGLDLGGEGERGKLSLAVAAESGKKLPPAVATEPGERLPLVVTAESDRSADEVSIEPGERVLSSESTGEAPLGDAVIDLGQVPPIAESEASLTEENQGSKDNSAMIQGAECPDSKSARQENDDIGVHGGSSHPQGVQEGTEGPELGLEETQDETMAILSLNMEGGGGRASSRRRKRSLDSESEWAMISAQNEGGEEGIEEEEGELDPPHRAKRARHAAESERQAEVQHSARRSSSSIRHHRAHRGALPRREGRHGRALRGLTHRAEGGVDEHGDGLYRAVMTSPGGGRATPRGHARHLVALSLETALESMRLDCPGVKGQLMAASRDWVRTRPLQMLLLGRWRPPKGHTASRKPVPSPTTDKTALACKKSFCRAIGRLMAAADQSASEVGSIDGLRDSMYGLVTNYMSFVLDRAVRSPTPPTYARRGARGKRGKGGSPPTRPAGKRDRILEGGASMSEILEGEAQVLAKEGKAPDGVEGKATRTDIGGVEADPTVGTVDIEASAALGGLEDDGKLKSAGGMDGEGDERHLKHAALLSMTRVHSPPKGGPSLALSAPHSSDDEAPPGAPWGSLSALASLAASYSRGLTAQADTTGASLLDKNASSVLVNHVTENRVEVSTNERSPVTQSVEAGWQMKGEKPAALQPIRAEGDLVTMEAAEGHYASGPGDSVRVETEPPEMEEGEEGEIVSPVGGAQLEESDALEGVGGRGRKGGQGRRKRKLDSQGQHEGGERGGRSQRGKRRRGHADRASSPATSSPPPLSPQFSPAVPQRSLSPPPTSRAPSPPRYSRESRYADSFLSSAVDPYDLSLEFDAHFDPLRPPPRHYDNPYRLSSALIEQILWGGGAPGGVGVSGVGGGDLWARLTGSVVPDVGQAGALGSLLPRSAFLHALALAVREERAGDARESYSGENLTSPGLPSDGAAAPGIPPVAGTGKFVKGNNPLMQAFKQVIEAKKRAAASLDGKPAPTSDPTQRSKLPLVRMIKRQGARRNEGVGVELERAVRREFLQFKVTSDRITGRWARLGGGVEGGEEESGGLDDHFLGLSAWAARMYEEGVVGRVGRQETGEGALLDAASGVSESTGQSAPLGGSTPAPTGVSAAPIHAPQSTAAVERSSDSAEPSSTVASVVGSVPTNVGSLPVTAGRVPATVGAVPATVGAVPAVVGAVPSRPVIRTITAVRPPPIVQTISGVARVRTPALGATQGVRFTLGAPQPPAPSRPITLIRAKSVYRSTALQQTAAAPAAAAPAAAMSAASSTLVPSSVPSVTTTTAAVQAPASLVTAGSTAPTSQPSSSQAPSSGLGFAPALSPAPPSAPVPATTLSQTALFQAALAYTKSTTATQGPAANPAPGPSPLKPGVQGQATPGPIAGAATAASPGTMLPPPMPPLALGLQRTPTPSGASRPFYSPAVGATDQWYNQWKYGQGTPGAGGAQPTPTGVQATPASLSDATTQASKPTEGMQGLKGAGGTEPPLEAYFTSKVKVVPPPWVPPPGFLSELEAAAETSTDPVTTATPATAAGPQSAATAASTAAVSQTIGLMPTTAVALTTAVPQPAGMVARPVGPGSQVGAGGKSTWYPPVGALLGLWSGKQRPEGSPAQAAAPSVAAFPQGAPPPMFPPPFMPAAGGVYPPAPMMIPPVMPQAPGAGFTGVGGAPHCSPVPPPGMAGGAPVPQAMSQQAFRPPAESAAVPAAQMTSPLGGPSQVGPQQGAPGALQLTPARPTWPQGGPGSAQRPIAPVAGVVQPTMRGGATGQPGGVRAQMASGEALPRPGVPPGAYQGSPQGAFYPGQVRAQQRSPVVGQRAPQPFGDYDSSLSLQQSMAGGAPSGGPRGLGGPQPAVGGGPGVSPALASSQGQAPQRKNIRMYVFNRDKPICAGMEKFLRFAGIPKFDPYNVASLRALPHVECHVLVQRADLAHLAHIPNLLRLKRDLRVMFVVYDHVDDFRLKRFSLIFPRAGLVVMDTPTLLALQPDVLEALCEFMHKQTTDKRAAWTLKLSPTIFSALQQLSYRCEAEGRTDDSHRLVQLSRLLVQYRQCGVVELLPGPRAPACMAEYQAVCVGLQASLAANYRHFLFVSDLPRNKPDARLFMSSGVDVMSIVEFMRGFVAKTVEHRPVLYPPHVTRLTSLTYTDALLSRASETLIS